MYLDKLFLNIKTNMISFKKISMQHVLSANVVSSLKSLGVGGGEISYNDYMRPYFFFLRPLLILNQ